MNRVLKALFLRTVGCLYYIATDVFCLAVRICRLFVAKRNRVLIVPPCAPGSLGDEAMLVALVDELVRQQQGVKIDAVAYSEDKEWSELAGIDQDILYTKRHGIILSFAIRMISYDVVYAVGADILDGKYGDSVCLRIVKLMKIASRTGAEVKMVGVSFNEQPSSVCVAALRALPHKIIFKARDPISKMRLEKWTQREVVLTADMAFLLAPTNTTELADTERWILSEKKSGRVVIGINLNHLCREFYGNFPEAIRDLFKKQKVSFVGISHDYRTSVTDTTLLEELVSSLPQDICEHFYLVPTPRSASEIKGICRYLDLVFSARMHLAIAALGMEIPVGCMVYQGKFKGLFEGIFGLMDCLIDPADAVDVDRLTSFIIDLIDCRDVSSAKIKECLPTVRLLSKQNI